MRGLRQELDGWDHNRFHARRKAGELLTYTPLVKTLVKYGGNIAGTYGPIEKPTNKFYWIKTGEWIPGVAYNQLSYGNLLNTASTLEQGLNSQPMVQACAAKIYSQGHDTLTFLVELRKTAALFKNLTSKLKNLLDLSKAAGNWLEFRYGWRILYYDILDIQRVLSNLDDTRKRFSDRVGQGQTEISVSTVPYTDGGVKGDVVVTDTIHTSIRGAITADLEPPKFQFNPAVTGWEVIKFSFIIDWFISVGTWLESLSFLAVSSNYVAAGGTLVTIDRDVRCENFVTYNGHVNHGTLDPGGPYSVSVTKITRTPTTVPLRPYANIRLDALKVVDLVALFVGLGKGFSGALRI